MKYFPEILCTAYYIGFSLAYKSIWIWKHDAPGFEAFILIALYTVLKIFILDDLNNEKERNQ